MSNELLPPLPEGDRFSDVLKFRRIGTGGGDTLYECWGEALIAYAAAAVAAERERWSKVEGYAFVVHPEATGIIQALPEGQWVILQRRVKPVRP